MKLNLRLSIIILSFTGFFSITGAQTTVIDGMKTGDEDQQSDTLKILSPEELFNSLPTPSINKNVVNKSFIPKVFGGYRKVHHIPEFTKIKPYNGIKTMTYVERPDSTEEANEIGLDPSFKEMIDKEVALEDTIQKNSETFSRFMEGKRPKWLTDALLLQRIQEDVMYLYMLENPQAIEYADWNLPEPPVLYEDDITFLSFIKKQELPEISPNEAILPEEVELKKKHWLHTVNALLQFSQAYVSPNWYQGGNNYLALLFGFNWNVNLNQVFHPKLLFQSAFSYKLGLTSTPEGNIHKYQMSEDVLQYNLNTGWKALGNWYYSMNLLFKTQIFTNYEDNSWKRKASFLSPGDLNLGLGMSYNHKNKLNTFSYTLTIAPLSYNLKTCIYPNDKIGHAQFNIEADKKSKSEIGSNAELKLEWQIMANISYKTRVFAFTDYHYFLGDWQNTFSFDINKFLSTQLFINLRWDTSADRNTSWKTFMMREILSFGLSYTFSTKP